MVSVHRGFWGPLPENSLAAIRKASAWDVVEIDLRLDEAGQPYLMHDATLTRTTGAWAASDGVDAGLMRVLRLKEGAGGDDATMSNEGVPALAEAFSALSDDAIFDLDVKRDEDIEAVAAFVAQFGQGGRGTLKIDVPTEWDITRLRALEERHDVMVMAKLALRSDEDLGVVELLRAAGVAAVEVSYTSVDILARACAIGGDSMRLGVYTLDGIHCCGMADAKALEDPGKVWGRLVDAGVGLIMTDRASELSDYLSSR